MLIDKKKGLLLILIFLLIIPLVHARFFSSYGNFGPDVNSLYLDNYQYVDFILGFIIFGSLVRLILEKRFGHNVTALSIALGLALAIGLVTFENKYLGEPLLMSAGCISILFFALLIGVGVHGFLRMFGAHKIFAFIMGVFAFALSIYSFDFQAVAECLPFDFYGFYLEDIISWLIILGIVVAIVAIILGWMKVKKYKKKKNIKDAEEDLEDVEDEEEEVEKKQKRKEKKRNRKDRNWDKDLQKKYNQYAAEANAVCVEAGNHIPSKRDQPLLYRKWKTRNKAVKKIEEIAKSRGIKLHDLKGKYNF